jgi:hypothetical protein
MGGNTELPLDNLWHELNTVENSSAIGEFLGAEHRLDAGFHALMILLHDIVQVRTTTDLRRVFPTVIKFVSHAHAPQRGTAGFEAIQRDRREVAVT